MESSRLEEALLHLIALRKADRSRDLGADIQSLLSQPWSPDEARTLRGELLAEHHRHDRHDEAETLLLAEVEREPAEPFHSLRLAAHFHYYDVDLQRSLHHVSEAISKAKTDGKFLYQALGVQARLAIEVQNWPLLEATLHEMTAYVHTPGNADVFPETDFLSHIPADAISSAAIEAYTKRVDYLRSIGYSTMYGARRGGS